MRVYLPLMLNIQLFIRMATRAALPEFCKKSANLVPISLVTSFLIYGIRGVIEIYEVLLNLDINSVIWGGTNIFSILSWSMALVGGVYYIYRHYQMKADQSIASTVITFSEYQVFVFLISLVIAVFAIIISNIVLGANRWQDMNEGSLTSYAFIQLMFVVLLTGKHFSTGTPLYQCTSPLIAVLPGRIIRIYAAVNLDMLALKQIFVRYVSHEIRWQTCSIE